jgi:hypothetical protein
MQISASERRIPVKRRGQRTRTFVLAGHHVHKLLHIRRPLFAGLNCCRSWLRGAAETRPQAEFDLVVNCLKILFENNSPSNRKN